MSLFGFAFHKNENPWDDAPPWAIEQREISLVTIELLRIIIRKDRQMALDTTKLLADVTAQTTVLQGVVVAQKGLSDNNAALTKQVADLQAAVTAAGTPDPAVQAALDAIDATVQSNTTLVSGLVPAVTANTPSA